MHDVVFAYRRSTPLLQGISLTVGPGLTLLVGPNGCGKSTLLKLMAGVECPDSGSVTVNGLDLWQHEVAARSLLAYVPEQPDVSPYASIAEVLELVAALRGERRGRVAEVEAQFGIEQLGSRSIRELSKGQRRRVLLAAAHLGSPPVLLLDEPFDALDRKLRAEFLGWLKHRLDNGAVIVVVTHELEPLVHLAVRAVSVVDGRAVFQDVQGTFRQRLDTLEPLARGH